MTRLDDSGPMNPYAPQDPMACNHPGAYVHALAGGHPRPLPGVDEPDPVAFRPTPHGSGRRRPGEQFSAALGECSACGSLVASLEIWHPDDIRGENGVTYLTSWVPLYRGGTPPGRPVPARDTTADTAPDHADGGPPATPASTPRLAT